MAALCVLLTVVCGYDYKSGKIPNFLIALMMAAGVGWRFWQGGVTEVLSYVGETFLTICLLYPLFKIGTVGAGDVKLLGVTAGYLPFKKILIFLFFSLLIAAVISLVKMLKRGNFTERMKYFFGYLKDVIESGSWRLYLENEKDKSAAGICLSGPVLVSVLLYLGGIY